MTRIFRMADLIEVPDKRLRNIVDEMNDIIAKYKRWTKAIPEIQKKFGIKSKKELEILAIGFELGSKIMKNTELGKITNVLDKIMPGGDYEDIDLS